MDHARSYTSFLFSLFDKTPNLSYSIQNEYKMNIKRNLGAKLEPEIHILKNVITSVCKKFNYSFFFDKKIELDLSIF